MNLPLLSLTIWIPIAGAFLVTVFPKSATKGIAALASFAAMVASILVTGHFRADPSAPPFQLQEQHPWIRFGSGGQIEYFLGVDGISVTMVLGWKVLSIPSSAPEMTPWSYPKSRPDKMTTRPTAKR